MEYFATVPLESRGLERTLCVGSHGSHPQGEVVSFGSFWFQNIEVSWQLECKLSRFCTGAGGRPGPIQPWPGRGVGGFAQEARWPTWNRSWVPLGRDTELVEAMKQ